MKASNCRKRRTNKILNYILVLAENTFFLTMRLFYQICLYWIANIWKLLIWTRRIETLEAFNEEWVNSENYWGVWMIPYYRIFSLSNFRSEPILTWISPFVQQLEIPYINVFLIDKVVLLLFISYCSYATFSYMIPNGISLFLAYSTSHWIFIWL